MNKPRTDGNTGPLPHMLTDAERTARRAELAKMELEAYHHHMSIVHSLKAGMKVKCLKTGRVGELDRPAHREGTAHVWFGAIRPSVWYDRVECKTCEEPTKEQREAEPTRWCFVESDGAKIVEQIHYKDLE